jgi:hypothetical protein
MHRGAPLIPSGVLHALARIASHARPQPLQFVNDGSSRPFVPAGTESVRHVVPQHRWLLAQVGRQSPIGSIESRVPPSIGVPVHTEPMQRWPTAHVTPHLPQFVMSSPSRAHA